MQELFKNLIKKTGEDITRDGLLKTPERAEKAYKFLTSGYNEDIDKIVNNAIYEAHSDDMIIVKDIELYSLCEHHLLPFFGKCHVAYIPSKKIIGVSKIARIVDVYAKRLQIQENLTRQIADTIMKFTGATGVGVVIDAKHLCMMMRGVQKQNSVMKTSCMLGDFRSDLNTRNEFINLIQG
jgi:GTP cyclohydrolase IA